VHHAFALYARFSGGHQQTTPSQTPPLKSPSPLHLQYHGIVRLDLSESRAKRTQRVDRYLVHAVDDVSSLQTSRGTHDVRHSCHYDNSGRIAQRTHHGTYLIVQTERQYTQPRNQAVTRID